MSSEHPGDDLLADLAAGQLRGTRAERVEAHVLTCAACGDLLAGAEEVRSLLRRQPVPAMPDDVTARLTALVGSVVTGTTPAPAGSAPTTGTPTTGTPTTGTPTTGTPTTGTPVSGDRTAPTRILRPVTGRRLTPMGGDSRREQRTEERTDVRRGRWGSLARVAAGVVAVAVLGGGAIAGARALRGSGQDAASGAQSGGTAADSSAERSAALATPVLATGRKYEASRLKAQVDELVADSRQQPKPVAGQAGSSTAGSAASSATGTLAASSGELLRSESGLAGCLRAIGRGDDRALAVDLATYQDREAAVIVLQQPDGSFEVWIVARDCRPGADGTIAVRTINP